MADFLIMHDASGLAQDSRDLERPRGLPKVRRNQPGHPGTTSIQVHPQGNTAGTDTAVMRMPSAAQGIRAESGKRQWGQAQDIRRWQDAELAQHEGGPADGWQQAVEPCVGTAAHGGTGMLQEGTETQVGATHGDDAAAIPGPECAHISWTMSSAALGIHAG